MKILALDQSSRVSGYAIFDNGNLIDSGKFTVDDTNMGIRLFKIKRTVEKLIDDNNIELVAFEDIQLQDNKGPNNVVTYKKLAEVFGVLEELCTEKKIPYKIIHSQTWKSELNIKGYERTQQKKSAQEYIFNTYGKKVSQDESDAICIGICASREEESAF